MVNFELSSSHELRDVDSEGNYHTTLTFVKKHDSAGDFYADGGRKIPDSDGNKITD